MIEEGVSCEYDDRCRREFRSLHARVQHLFIDIDIPCPYGLPYTATFHQATFAPLGDRAMELFLAAGYRRNGNNLYNMYCRECAACIPIRLHPEEFSANRNQRRTLARNQDVVKALSPLQPTREEYLLCEKFLQTRYPRENNTAIGYFRDFFVNSIVNSAELQYRVDGRLVGSAIIDIGYNWMNAVYFYFDPDESKRSLGTYNILCLIELCREWDIEFLYLGYFIPPVPAMSYKGSFHPHYLLVDNNWQRKG
ncbi:MAG: arginyltransferase [Desulforhopalus sp.]|nr:arginyltransferase [Desulforhopalus sp.]